MPIQILNLQITIFQILGQQLSSTFEDERILGSLPSLRSLSQCRFVEKRLLSSLEQNKTVRKTFFIVQNKKEHFEKLF
jgi:hypothetical protein